MSYLVVTFNVDVSRVAPVALAELSGPGPVSDVGRQSGVSGLASQTGPVSPGRCSSVTLIMDQSQPRIAGVDQ